MFHFFLFEWVLLGVCALQCNQCNWLAITMSDNDLDHANLLFVLLKIGPFNSQVVQYFFFLIQCESKKSPLRLSDTLPQTVGNF